MRIGRLSKAPLLVVGGHTRLHDQVSACFQGLGWQGGFSRGSLPSPGLCSSSGQLNQIQPLYNQQMWVIDMVCLHNMNLVAIASTDQKIGESLVAAPPALGQWESCTCMWEDLSLSQLCAWIKVLGGIAGW